MFDRSFLRLRARRALKAPERADFLRHEAAGGILARLESAGRTFPETAIVGSGRGVFARTLAGKAGIGSLIQYESSPEAVAFCAKSGDAALSRDGFPPQERLFDLIVAPLWLHWSEDPPGDLVRLRGHLRKGGFFVGVLFAGASLQELRRALTQAESAIMGGGSPHVAPMADLRDLGDMLQRAGFADPVADRDRLTLLYPSMRALMREIGAMGEANALAARRRAPLRRDVLAHAEAFYRAHWQEASGRIRASVDIAYVSGWQR